MEGIYRQSQPEHMVLYRVFFRFARIARVTSHIPDKGQVMIRYHGLYSNAHRGKMRKAGIQISHPPIIEDDSSYVPSKGWAEMI